MELEVYSGDIDIEKLCVSYEIEDLTDTSTLFETLRVIVQERQGCLKNGSGKWSEYIHLREPFTMNAKYTPLEALQSRSLIRDMFEFNVKYRCCQEKEDTALNLSIARLAVAYLNLAKCEETVKNFLMYKLQADIEIQTLKNLFALRNAVEDESEEVHKYITALILPLVNTPNPGQLNTPILLEVSISVSREEIYSFKRSHDFCYYVRSKSEITDPAIKSFKASRQIEIILPLSYYEITHETITRIDIKCPNVEEMMALNISDD